MSQSIDIKQISHSTNGALRKISKFHYLILMGLCVAGMIFTIYYINNILSNPPSSARNVQQVGFSDTFDTETVKKINKFKYRTETTNPLPPRGRSNPFAE